MYVIHGGQRIRPVLHYCVMWFIFFAIMSVCLTHGQRIGKAIIRSFVPLQRNHSAVIAPEMFTRHVYTTERCVM